MNLSDGAGGSTYTGKYANFINASAEKYGVDPWLIACVIQAESTFDPNASSGVAFGLMQLTPDTARSLGVSNFWDPAQNIDGGTKYLSQLLKTFNGSIPEALAGYNWGPANPSIRNYPDMSGWPSETRNYVNSIMANYSKHNAGATVAVNPTGATVTTTSLGTKAGEVIKSPILWVVVLAGLLFKA